MLGRALQHTIYLIGESSKAHAKLCMLRVREWANGRADRGKIRNKHAKKIEN